MAEYRLKIIQREVCYIVVGKCSGREGGG